MRVVWMHVRHCVGTCGSSPSLHALSIITLRACPALLSDLQTFNTLALPLVTSLVGGQSSVLLTFGVTNSGKSHTIIGGAGEAQGIVPRLFDAILSQLASG